MKLLINACVFIATVAHGAFWFAQMFLWKTAFVQEKLLGDFTIKQKAEILAHNQGLYNGFLAVGLLWGLLALNSKTPEIDKRWVAAFFLACAFVAGVYGSISLGRPTAFILQSLPGVIALPLILIGKQKQQEQSTSNKQPT